MISITCMALLHGSLCLSNGVVTCSDVPMYGVQSCEAQREAAQFCANAPPNSICISTAGGGFGTWPPPIPPTQR
jgi:hypothetical protein